MAHELQAGLREGDVLRGLHGARLSRRAFIKDAGLLGFTAIGASGLLAAGSLEARAAPADPRTPPDLAAARKEGTLVVVHGDIESDVVEFLRDFTRRTGIPATEQRLLPGAALPKFEAELRAGVSSVDVYDTSDIGVMELLRTQGHLMEYHSRELTAYAPRYQSAPPGYWTAYGINVGTIMYSRDFVSKAEAPKTWMDLLNPRWVHQIGVQDASAGTQYTWWYVLKDILPADYWTKLAAQKPRGYSSSTQIVTDILRGDLKIGGKVSMFQYVKAVRKQDPLVLVLPPEGAPTNLQVTGIIAGTRRPNAAKAYIDYFLSRDGQQTWMNTEGLYSPRPDTSLPEIPPISKIKVLLPKNLEEYTSGAEHEKFVKLWNQIVGF